MTVYLIRAASLHRREYDARLVPAKVLVSPPHLPPTYHIRACPRRVCRSPCFTYIRPRGRRSVEFRRHRRTNSQTVAATSYYPELHATVERTAMTTRRKQAADTTCLHGAFRVFHVRAIRVKCVPFLNVENNDSRSSARRNRVVTGSVEIGSGQPRARQRFT
jgi:hypothetical protein